MGGRRGIGGGSQSDSIKQKKRENTRFYVHEIEFKNV